MEPATIFGWESSALRALIPFSAAWGSVARAPFSAWRPLYKAWVEGCGVSGSGFIFFSSPPRHPSCWLNEGAFFAFGGKHWVGAYLQSKASPWFEAGGSLGEVRKGQSSGFLPASLGSDSEGMTPPLVGGVASCMVSHHARPLALFQHGPGLWEIGGHTYCCVPRAGSSTPS